MNSNDTFWGQTKTGQKKCCQIGWISCPILQVAQKSSSLNFNFFHVFAIHSSDERRFQNLKDFLWYSATVETYRGKSRHDYWFGVSYNVSKAFLSIMRIHYPLPCMTWHLFPWKRPDKGFSPCYFLIDTNVGRNYTINQGL